MKEDLQVRQVSGERKRRWFSSDDFDLILWLNEDDSFWGFELCYDKCHDERALIWRPTSGFSHVAVDDGEGEMGRYKATPIMVADGFVNIARIYRELGHMCHSLPADVAEFVMGTIETHPDWHPGLPGVKAHKRRHAP